MTKFATNAFQKYGLRTVQSVLDELTSNMHLKAILCGQFGDYGVRTALCVPVCEHWLHHSLTCYGVPAIAA